MKGFYIAETNDRYMRKYDQIACIIHGAISAGLLFDVSENQETTEATTAQDTTCTDREPQEGTERATTTAGGETIAQKGNEPQSATESAETTADDTTPTAADTEPPRAAERAAGAGRVSKRAATTRPAAPQSHGTTKGIQRHHRPPKTAYRAIQRAAPHQKCTFSVWMYKTGSDPPKILGYPIFDRFGGQNLVRNFRGCI